jgi:hypothetical protein
MISLVKSERFQSEYTLYQSRVNMISNEEVKRQAEILLRSLVNEVTKLDNQHQEMFSRNQMPTTVGDVRGGILAIRKKLDTLVTDWEKSNSK